MTIRLNPTKATTFPSIHFLSIWTRIERPSFSQEAFHNNGFQLHAVPNSVPRVGGSSTATTSASKKAFMRLSRIANAKGLKSVITKKPIVAPSDGFLSRWARIGQHSSLQKLPRQ